MGHKCFISYKTEDSFYKLELAKLFSREDIIDKSLKERINSTNSDYIMQTIRSNYLGDATVTLFLIGTHSSEYEGRDVYGEKNYYIQKELQASLYDGEKNSRSGIVGIVLPEMYNNIYTGDYKCFKCGCNHYGVHLDDTTVIREFSANYHIEPNSKCCWFEEDRYCILVTWSDFVSNPKSYVDLAYEKRYSEISKKIKIYGLR